MKANCKNLSATLCTGILLLFSFQVQAQIEYIGRPKINYINTHNKVWNIQGLYNTGRYGINSSFIKLHDIKPKRRVQYGIGLHASLAYISQKLFKTAATPVIKNSNNWLAFTFSDIEENIDTLVINSSAILTGNLYACLQYRINYNHEIGLQIDLGGASFGIPVAATLISSLLPGHQVSVRAMPTLFNYTLLSSNNRGSLYYNLYYCYWFNDRLGANFNISYLYTEFRTLQSLVFNTSRFRNKGFCFMLGISYAPFYNKYKD
ncbi:MAG: hypothetical protein IT238_10675 [Bacteroidia bacterium]|nr:hypothetical protein [Bacteroidia bacterium]MCZ2248971.1 hypothetical protein [Bacteroidia bacterium]